MEQAKVSEQLEAFLDFLRDTGEQFRMADANRIEAEAATQDILHALELGQYESAGRAWIGLKLQEVRRKRRAAKDTLNQTRPVVEWTKENHAIVKGLERLLGEVRKVERQAVNRTYTPRTHVLDEMKGKEGAE